ncbi:amidohydrolase family protein [Halomonas denitrificans]|nr:amidohydrolase [Halomonas denitrificans]
MAWRSTSSSAETGETALATCAPKPPNSTPPSALRALPAVVLIASLLTACRPPQAPLPEDLAHAPVAFDHHVHLLGPRLVSDWSAVGAEFSRDPRHYASASAVFDAPAGARGALLVPMAHLYASDGFAASLALTEEEAHARARAENDHVAAAAVASGGRARALCSIDPLRAWALEELHRCTERKEVIGIKLHLATAGIDPRNERHLEALAATLDAAVEAGHLVLLHLDPQLRDLDIDDIQRLLDRVIQPHPDIRLVIAHLGGSGGYGSWTQQVFGRLLDWLESERSAGRERPGLRFDVSAVWLEEASEGVPASLPEHADALARDLARAGPERLLFGSDWPLFEPGRYAAVLRYRVTLGDGFWDRVLENRAVDERSPPIDPAGTAARAAR